MSVQVTFETTPNEHALKFSVNKQILDSDYKTFNSLEEAKDFPVAAKIFVNEAVASIFMIAQPSSAFITVSKKPVGAICKIKSSKVLRHRSKSG
jgi:hypothetical protein